MPAQGLQRFDDLGLQRSEALTGNTLCVRMNVTAPPFDKLDVRRAVQLARETGDVELLREVMMLRLIVSSGRWETAERLAIAEELLALDVDLLIPAALEDAITKDNAGKLETFALKP